MVTKEIILDILNDKDNFVNIVKDFPGLYSPCVTIKQNVSKEKSGKHKGKWGFEFYREKQPGKPKELTRALFIDDISKYIDNHLNKIHELELTRSGLLDFGDFFDIQYDVDADGDVYPDVYDEFAKGGATDKKKKGKGGKGVALPQELEEEPKAPIK
jgi:hypothetical protein